MKHIYVLFVLALFLVGCGNNEPAVDNNVADGNSQAIISNPGDTSTTPTDTAATEETTSQTNVTVDETPKDIQVKEDNTKEDTTDSEDNEDNVLKELFSDRTLKYTGEYTISAEESMDDVIYAFDLPKFVTIMKVGNGEIRNIFDGTDMISCSSIEGPWQCFKMSVAQTQSIRTEEEISTGKATSRVIGECNVAGESGTKYEITSSDGMTSQVCYTNDGILLEMYTADPEYHMKATSISRFVDSSLFVAPAEAQDISELMAGVTQ
ncbi:MAG: hypothetical protein ACP5NW_05985 [Candidatus Woesearchaeota archaeon]